MTPDPLDTFHKHIRYAVQLHAAAQRQEALMLYYQDTIAQRDHRLEKAEAVAKVLPSSYILLQFVQTLRESFTE